MQFADDEIETLKEILSDWGSDMPCAEYTKVHAIGVKLGVWEEEKPPTEEELKRREEFRNSPFGKQMAAMFSQTNEYLKKVTEDIMEDNSFFSGEQCFFSGKQWPVGTTLKIKVPDDWNK